MARSTRARGASYTPEELNDPDPPAVIIRRAELGYVDRKEEVPSVGMDSSPPSEKDSKSSEIVTANPPQPAPEMESHSGAQEAEMDSTAHSTGTRGRRATQRQSAKKATSRATVIDDEDFDDEDF